MVRHHEIAGGVTVEWLILVYRLGAHQSTQRVHLWRRIKRIGAVYLQDGVCLLPLNERTREQMEWLAAEIAELGGVSYLAEAGFLASGQQERAVDLFRRQSQETYAKVRELLDRARAEVAPGELLREAWRLYAAARQLEFFPVEESAQLYRELAALTEKMHRLRMEGDGPCAGQPGNVWA